MRLWDRWEHWREQPSASMCSWCLRSGKGRGGGTVDLKQTNSNIANMQTVVFSQEFSVSWVMTHSSHDLYRGSVTGTSCRKCFITLSAGS